MLATCVKSRMKSIPSTESALPKPACKTPCQSNGGLPMTTKHKLGPGDDLQMIQSPGLWPKWPFLPVKRWINNDMETGIILACQGQSSTVFILNLFRLPTKGTFQDIVNDQSI